MMNLLTILLSIYITFTCRRPNLPVIFRLMQLFISTLIELPRSPFQDTHLYINLWNEMNVPMSWTWHLLALFSRFYGNFIPMHKSMMAEWEECAGKPLEIIHNPKCWNIGYGNFVYFNHNFIITVNCEIVTCLSSLKVKT